MPNDQNNGFAVAVTTETGNATNWPNNRTGMLDGEKPSSTAEQIIRVDQGLDTDEIDWQLPIDQALKETQYIVEIDNRLGTIASPVAPYGPAQISFIDDDNVASYYLSTNDRAYVMNITEDDATWEVTENNKPDVATIRGPQGTFLKFKIRSSLDLISSNFLFGQLGSELAAGDESGWGLLSANTYQYIDTIVKITGATTGYKIDIPVRFMKKTA